MSIEIRTARPEEYRAYVEAISRAFLDRPDLDRLAAEVTPIWDPARTWGAFDGDRVCGTFRSWATELTLPGGGRVPGSAVSAVTVLPTHRRRGILTAMAAAEGAAIRERGEAVGLLYASEYPIYGRFGYGPATRSATWTLDALATGFHGVPVAGVELTSPDDAAVEVVKAVFEGWRVRQPGEIRRRDHSWGFDLGLVDTAWGKRWNGFLALRRDAAGAVDGYVRYEAEEKWERRQPRVILKVNELHALNDEAYAALWRFLAETDLVSTATAGGRSPAERLPWLLTNGRAAAPSEIGEALWVRLFDVPRVLEARTYARSGALVLEVVDAEQRGGRTRLALEASPDGARCRPTSRTADLVVPVAALGAASLGGSRLRDAVLATGVEEARPGALAEADGLFASIDEPWCSTFF